MAGARCEVVGAERCEVVALAVFLSSNSVKRRMMFWAMSRRW